MSTSNVILYRYDVSPYSHKIDHVLLLKEIPHSIVNTARLPPRPEISSVLGITYRQIPILAIGNDVYCDTSLITSVLEKKYSTEEGFKSLYSPRKSGGALDTALVKAFSKQYGDVLFPLAAGLMPWDVVPKDVAEDRQKFFGMNPAMLKAVRPHTLGQYISNLALLDEQLADGREWLFDTIAPTLADISVHFIVAWTRGIGETAHLDAQKLPHLVKWFTRMESHIKEQKASAKAPTELKGDDAGQQIISAPHEDYAVVGFNEVDAGKLGLKLGDSVSVFSTSVKESNPTVGTLVALDVEQVVLEVKGANGTVRVHFPRIGYMIKGDKGKL